MTEPEIQEIKQIVGKVLDEKFAKLPFANRRDASAVYDAYNETISQLTGNPKPSDTDEISTLR